jgi:hypothetical protein
VFWLRQVWPGSLTSIGLRDPQGTMPGVKRQPPALGWSSSAPICSFRRPSFRPPLSIRHTPGVIFWEDSTEILCADLPARGAPRPTDGGTTCAPNEATVKLENLPRRPVAVRCFRVPSSLITHHSLLITHHPSPITHYSVLASWPDLLPDATLRPRGARPVCT